MAATKENIKKRTKYQIEKDRKLIWEIVCEKEEISNSEQLISQLKEKGVTLSWSQIRYTLEEETDKLLNIFRDRKRKKHSKNYPEETVLAETTGNETNNSFSKNVYNKIESADDTIWTIDASVICPPKEMAEILRILTSLSTIVLTYVTFFEILRFIECTDDGISKGAKTFLDFYLENRNKFKSVPPSPENLDLKKLTNTERDDLLVHICTEKNLSLITSDRAMAAKAVFAGCEVNYLKKMQTTNFAIPPLKKVGENYYFRGTSTSDIKYSIPKKEINGYTLVSRGEFLYVAKKGFLSVYLIDTDWTYCLLYTIKFYNKYNLPKDDLTEYTL